MFEKLKIEFGCGGRKLDGWICTDIDECDITKPLPWRDGEASMVFCSHVVEHVNTHQCLAFFQEVHRILNPGGCFRIIVPILDRITDRGHAIDLILNHGHQQVFSPESLRKMLWAAGFNYQRIHQTEKNTILDVHDKQIGELKDGLESCRIEAWK